MHVATEIVASEPNRAARAPTDVLRLAVAVGSLLVVVLVGALFDEAIVGFVADLVQGIEALPSWLVTAVIVIGQILGIVVLVGGAVVAVVRRNWIVLALAAAAAAVAVLLTLVILPLVDDVAPQVAKVDESYTLVAPDQVVSTMGLAVLAAVVTAASPWIARRWRRAGWTVVIIATLTRFLGAQIEFDTLVAVLTGWAAGAAAIVALGAPSRRPSGESVAAGLASVGVPLARLEQASLDARGSTPYFATSRDGSSLFVKALGEDERSADLLFRVYRRIQPRDLGDEKAFSSLRRAVEHEALVAFAARDLGIRTPRVVAFANAEPNGYVLAYEAISGRSLDRLEADEMSDDVLAKVWTELARMRTHRIAHRDLRLANVFLADDGAAWIIDFGFSELAASDHLLATDLAELLASSATKVGAERAVAAGVAVVGAGAIRTALDRLGLPRLSGATRTAVKADPRLLPDLRRCIVSVSPGEGTPPGPHRQRSFAEPGPPDAPPPR
ncbi:MAG: lipopolysaccharide kinase InaA family protein [Acidimicrobiales bacterium]